MAPTRAEQYHERWAALQRERQSWLEHWRELADVFLPRRPRFLVTDRNRGTKRNDKIVHSGALTAARTLVSGLLVSYMSPTRIWARLNVAIDELREEPGVREWLHAATRRAHFILNSSNWYDAAGVFLEDLVVFNTAAMFGENDEERLLHFTPLPIGSYALATDATGRVDTCYRECGFTVRQLVERFGRARVSAAVRQDYDRGQYDRWVGVLHVVEPHAAATPGLLDRHGMPYRSCWLELGADARDRFLGEHGYRRCPVIAARFTVTGEDVYGRGPSMDALGDAKALQQAERKALRYVGKLCDPPLNTPARNQADVPFSLAEGAVNEVRNPQIKTEPALVLPPAGLQAIEGKIAQLQARIDDIMYRRLWTLFADDARPQPTTAEEVRAKKEEKRLILGAQVQRASNEVLDPAFEMAFERAVDLGLIAAPPPALAAAPLTVEKLNLIEQAQRAQDLAGARELVLTVAQLAAVEPTVVDKVDWDQFIDEMADRLDVAPAVIRDDETVARRRAARAQQQQQAEAAAAIPPAADAAKTLAETPVGTGTALDAVLRGVA